MRRKLFTVTASFTGTWPLHKPPLMAGPLEWPWPTSLRGPFRDARGSALITNDMTTATDRDDIIDPAVIIDDDGQAYLFWGKTQCYYAKLKENMIELASSIKTVQLPDFME